METLLALLLSLGLISPTPTPPDVLGVQEQILRQQTTHPTASFSQISSFGTLITSPSPTPHPTPLPIPSPTPRPTRKDDFSIVLLGDSMVETLGQDLAELNDALRTEYPNTTFTMYNYGVGGKNINDGLTRILQDFGWQGQTKPPLISLDPDIIVVESFGYNPYTFDEGALETHWLAMAYIVDTIEQQLPDADIVMFTTIAPDAETFGDGVPLLNFTPAEKAIKAATIKRYIENTIKFAESEGLLLADAYNPSIGENGNGKDEYINPGDHIHYSDEGRQFVSSIITEVIAENGLLE